MEKQRRVISISPILQGLLARQIHKVNEALDSPNMDRAYRCVQSLYKISPPSVKKEVFDDLSTLREELKEAKESDGVDEYNRRRSRSAAIKRVYLRRVGPLFERIVDELYAQNYMETYAKDIDTNIPPELLGEKLSTT